MQANSKVLCKFDACKEKSSSPFQWTKLIYLALRPWKLGNTVDEIEYGPCCLQFSKILYLSFYSWTVISITVLRKCSVCFTHSLYYLHKESWTWKHWRCLCGGGYTGVCECTSFAILYQHWHAAHIALQRFEYTGRILKGCYPTYLIRFDLHAVEFESSLWKGILMHLQHGLKSYAFVQV